MCGMPSCVDRLQINAMAAKGVRIPSESKIKFFFRHLDKCRLNREHLDEAIGTSRHGKGKTPDPSKDIELLVDLLKARIGSTYAMIQEASTASKLASPELGIEMERSKVGWNLMFTHLPKLQEWAQGVVDKGELYKMPERPDDEDMIDLEEEGLVYEEDGDLDGRVEEEDGGYDSESEAVHRTKSREAAKRYTDGQYGKRLPKETDEEWVARVEVMIFEGRKARSTRSSRAKGGGGAGGEGDEDAAAAALCHEMVQGAAYSTLHEQEHERRPNKILEKEVKGGVLHYLTRVTDKGWHPPHRDTWRTRAWCLGFPGLVEEFEKVTHPEPHPDPTRAPITQTFHPSRLTHLYTEPSQITLKRGFLCMNTPVLITAVARAVGRGVVRGAQGRR